MSFLGNLRGKGSASLILVVTGLILFAVAAWMIAVPLGLAVAGLGCFGLDVHLDMERRKK